VSTNSDKSCGSKYAGGFLAGEKVRKIVAGVNVCNKFVRLLVCVTTNKEPHIKHSNTAGKSYLF
jgi:hypothetical protein